MLLVQAKTMHDYSFLNVVEGFIEALENVSFTFIIVDALNCDTLSIVLAMTVSLVPRPWVMWYSHTILYNTMSL